MNRATRVITLVTAAITALAIQGCAVPGQIPASAYPSVTGNWQILTFSGNTNVIGPVVLTFAGSLTSSGATVTGVGTFTELSISSQVSLPTACLLAVPATVTGTVDTLGNLSLTSSTVSGGTAAISLTTPTGTGLALGTIAINGGACPISTAAAGQMIPSVTGSFSGTLNAISATPNTIPSGTVALSLTQSTTPNTSGQFPLAGSITFTSTTPACSVTSSLTGYISGGGYHLQSAGQLPGITVTGAANATTANGPLVATLEILSGTCSLNGFQGTLTR
jgi:hypothetical protein